MIYAHGAYEIDVHVAEASATPEYNSDGVLVRRTRRHVIEGKVYGADQAALKTAILAFESAMATAVTESGLRHNDGATESAHWIDASGGGTERGIVASYRWISPPLTAQYVLYRSFQAQIECTFLGAGADEYEYSNRIERFGGEPVIVERRTVGGVVLQQAYPATAYRGVESGRKVSRAGLPVAKSPAYGGVLVASQPSNGAEKGADGITRYFVAWTYHYLSTAAF